MSPSTRIYLVDDDADLRDAMMETFELEKVPAKGFANGADLLAELDPEWDGVILSDVRMPGMTGGELLEASQKIAPNVPFVMITGHGDIASATAAMNRGAFDYIEKPARPAFLMSVLRRALKIRKLQLENARLRARMAKGGDIRARLLGRSEVMRECRRQLVHVAPLNVDTLLFGESGTGKHLAARCVHDHSPAKGDFIALSCATLSEENFADRVTSTELENPGALSLAKGGTLYLDGLTALGDVLQQRLIGLIEARKTPRLIASLSVAPRLAIEDGSLRSDLYYRLNVAEIELPPLRKRGRDMFFLLEYFIRDATARYGRKLPYIRAEDLQPFKHHDWPGNVRELRTMAERMVIGLSVQVLPGTDTKSDQSETYEVAMARFERDFLQAALRQAGGRKGLAANNLAIPRKRLYLRMRAVGLIE